MKRADASQTQKILIGSTKTKAEPDSGDSGKVASDLFADLEEALDKVAQANPRIENETEQSTKDASDLRALLEVSLAINSSLVLDEVLKVVMNKAIELMQAERGLVMLLDEHGEFQINAAYRFGSEDPTDDELRISTSVARQVADTGRSVYTSDAMADDRYAQQASILELHLRSIMCVPIMLDGRVFGVIYLDNSNQTKMFLKSDLYLFELFAQLVANALNNARLYDSVVHWKRYHETVVTKAPVGIVVIDSTGSLATINPVALEIFDLDREKIHVIGNGAKPTVFTEVLPEAERSRWQKMINTVLTTGQEYSDPRYFHNTGYIEKVLSLKLSPVTGLPNGDNGLTMTIEDITEKVVMEKYVILSEKLVARGEMAASVAHELNNYLSIISTNAELMSMNIDREKFEKVKFNSKSIVDNIFKIKRFIDSLMDFSKPEPEYISYNIKTVIDDLFFSLRIQPRFKQIEFSINMADDIPNAEMDVGQIQQVLMNLLNNAADAIEERATKSQAASKKITRSISIDGEYVRDKEQVVVRIGDNGSGMTPETLGKIFNLHFTTKKGGHGLGLHNCLKIVEQHRGELKAESVLGKGTTFTVVLPRFQDKDAD